VTLAQPTLTPGPKPIRLFFTGNVPHPAYNGIGTSVVNHICIRMLYLY
jgi:hypothetical protein